MAMEKAVLCSRTPGQTDVIVEGQTGLYVPPEDPTALRTKIQYLLDHPDLARTMGQAGRHRVESTMELTHYATGLHRYVQMALAKEQGQADARGTFHPAPLSS
jgi:hypothetical protein